jgi:hypothetical protein
MRNAHHLTSIPLNNWVLFYMSRDENKAQMFVEELIGVSQPMNFNINRAHMYKINIVNF